MALIGDPERERAAALLQKHYVQGRLTIEELAERLELAHAARRDSDVRVALADLPGAWFEQSTAWTGALWQSVRRVGFLVAVWSLWWIASLALMIGFVASVVAQGLSVVNAVAFPAVWLACTFLARRVTRRSARPR